MRMWRTLHIHGAVAWLALQRRGKKKRRGQERNIPHDTISTLAKLLGYGISLVDDEVLVKNLEDLTSLQVAHDEMRGTRRGLKRELEGNGGNCSRFDVDGIVLVPESSFLRRS